MNTYIFVTDEGFTYSNKSEKLEPDCENLQVLGLKNAKNAKNAKEAFNELIEENDYLKNTNFNKTWCYQLKSNDIKGIFYIKQK